MALAGGCVRQVRFSALLSEPADSSMRRRLTMVVRYMVRPGALLPLYAASVEMDVHPHFGKPQRVPPSPSSSPPFCWELIVYSHAGRAWRGRVCVELGTDSSECVRTVCLAVCSMTAMLPMPQRCTDNQEAILRWDASFD